MQPHHPLGLRYPGIFPPHVMRQPGPNGNMDGGMSELERLVNMQGPGGLPGMGHQGALVSGQHNLSG